MKKSPHQFIRKIGVCFRTVTFPAALVYHERWPAKRALILQRRHRTLEGYVSSDSMDQESMTVGWLFAPSGKFKGDFEFW